MKANSLITFEYVFAHTPVLRLMKRKFLIHKTVVDTWYPLIHSVVVIFGVKDAFEIRTNHAVNPPIMFGVNLTLFNV